MDKQPDLKRMKMGICSFCNKQGKTTLKSSLVQICDDCVYLCNWHTKYPMGSLYCRYCTKHDTVFIQTTEGISYQFSYCGQDSEDMAIYLPVTAKRTLDMKHKKTIK